MGNAARQLTDRLESLSLAQLALQAVPGLLALRLFGHGAIQFDVLFLEIADETERGVPTACGCFDDEPDEDALPGSSPRQESRGSAFARVPTMGPVELTTKSKVPAPRCGTGSGVKVVHVHLLCHRLAGEGQGLRAGEQDG